jgi:plastocyanin
MTKKHLQALLLILVALALGTVFLTACSRPGTASIGNKPGSGTSSSDNACPSGDTVNTGTSTFEQDCITLDKGKTLKIVASQVAFHIFDYGTWDNTTAKPEAAPAGAPEMKALQMTGASVEIGPFTTAGTYNIYCTVHPGMSLKIVVK